MAAATAASVSTVGAWCGGGQDAQGRQAGEYGYFSGPAAVAMTPAAPTTPNAPAAAKQVTIAGFAYSPSTLTVSRGTTVTWTNNDSAPHTVTSSGSGPLNSPTLGRGASYSFTFNSAGTFSYQCTIHSSMHGTIVVK